MEDKIIKRIEKLFALSGNNPNEKEAEAALLKAQKLMAEYGIEQSQLTGEKITYATVYSNVPPHRINNTLAGIIAKSFSCKVIIAYNHKGKRVLSFFGRTEFAEAANYTFEFVCKIMIRGGNRATRENGVNPGTKGAAVYYNSYCHGFIMGVKSKTDEQCKALMIVVPKDVEDSFHEKYKHCGTYKNKRGSAGTDVTSYLMGVTDGKSALGKRELNA